MSDSIKTISRAKRYTLRIIATVCERYKTEQHSFEHSSPQKLTTSTLLTPCYTFQIADKSLSKDSILDYRKIDIKKNPSTNNIINSQNYYRKITAYIFYNTLLA